MNENRRWLNPGSQISSSLRHGFDADFRNLFEELRKCGPGHAPTRALAAKWSGRTEGTFKRQFPVMAGATWDRFLLVWRMENGRMLLRSPFGSLKEISPACGYGTTRSFARAFHAYYGKPPRIGTTAD